MTFLNPAFLWALSLGAIPIALHLINRRPPKKVVFSHIAWLLQVHQSMMPRKRLKDRLLLAARTLLLLLLALFFARPVLHKGAVFAAGAEESVVILVDVSASMGQVDGGRDALDAARQQVQSLLAKFPTGTNVGLIAFSDRVEQELAPTAERSRVTSAIESLKVRPRPTDILPALRLAAGMLANQPSGRKSVLIVSDMAAHGWKAAIAEAGRWEGYDPEVAYVLWEVAAEKPDAGIAEASLQLSEEGVLKGRFTAVHQPGPGVAGDWSLTLNGRVVGKGRLPAKKGRADLPLQAQLPEGGFYAGELTLAPDAMPFDNTFYLAGRVPKGFRLLVVDGESGLAPTESESYYMRSALESPRDPRLRSIRVIRPELLAQESLANYDAIVLANVVQLAARQDEIVRWVEQGGGLFLTAGPRWPKAPETPLKFFRAKAWQSGRETVRPPETSAPIVGGVAGAQDFEWGQISVSQWVPLEKESSSAVLLSLSNGDPLLMLKQIGRGTVVCLATTLDRGWTNLAAKPAFPPLVREIIASLADPLREQTALSGFVDEPVRVPMPPGVANVTVAAPDGTSVSARVGKDGTLDWPAPQAPGLYRVRTDRADTDFAFAVNIRRLADEIDAARLTDDEIRAAFPRASAQMVRAGGRSLDGTLAALQGRDATSALMILIFILLALETALAWPRRRTA